MPAFADFTWAEIQSQPDAWAATLATLRTQTTDLRAFLAPGRFERVVLTGCGSTYYLALAAAGSLRTIAGLDATAFPASELWLNPADAYPQRRPTLLIAVSRSGETTETLQAVKAFQAAQRGQVLTISAYGERELAQLGDYNLVLEAGQEQSIAQTRAFTTLLIATIAVAAIAAGRDDLLGTLDLLPAACTALLQEGRALAHQLGTDSTIERCFFLGSGARYGLAGELSLKLKEMSLSESEPFHFLEYRHGPQSMARPGTLIVGLLSDAQRSSEQAVLDEMLAHGATVVALGAAPATIAIAAVPEALRGPLYVPWGQMLAYERAIARGLTPDQPSQLAAVVRLDAAETEQPA